MEININYYTQNEPKLDFSGLLGEPRLFTISRVGLEPNNPYLAYGQFLEYSAYYDFQKSDFHCVAAQYRDMTEIANNIAVSDVSEHNYGNEWITEYIEEDDIYLRFTGSRFHTAEEIEAEDKFWHELQRRRLELMRKWIPDYRSGAVRYGKAGSYYYVGNQSNDSDSDFRTNFDADTLEIITLDMLITDDWRQYLTDNDKFFAEYELCPSYWLDWSADKNITVLAYPVEPTEWMWRPAHLSVPRDKINKRYLTPQ